MKGHDPEFIRNRIEWRAGKHNFPYPCSNYWRKAPEKIANAVPKSFSNPVIYSALDAENFTVIGVDEVFIGHNALPDSFEIDRIRAIRPHPMMSSPTDKKSLSGLEVERTEGRVSILACEAGAPCFAIWNILLTLIGMKR
ncbi:hypothetical protein [Roseibacillus persicicus]|uniref:hypothetical protein n=1 Tax=Roseibacillus persicicus TaxID=454148 RepID=UPI001671D680|nr:hypothetical protein [Roseibacillus persicicus]